MAGSRFHSLDGLRGACALTVVLFHCDNLFHKNRIFQHGFLAVDMFFILSGFVIALTYEERLKDGVELKDFLRARARRLLPVYWLGAALNIAIFIWMATSGYYPPSFTRVMIWIVVPLTTMLMIPAYGTPVAEPYPAVMSITWSLVVEWFVNIAYAACFFRWKTRTLALLAAGGWLAMGIAGYFTGRGWCVGAITRDQVFTYGLLRGAPAFLAGVVIYRLHARRLFDRLPIVSTELLLTSWLCVAVVPTYTATPTFDWIVVTMFCPLLVVLLIRSDFKAPAFCKGLGELSYPLYASHPGIVLLAEGTPVFGLDRQPNPVRALVVVFTCIGVAWIVQKLAAGLPPLWTRRAPAGIAA
jgi:peptidoglycan/LPS O-acetylase OafA/YrhL